MDEIDDLGLRFNWRDSGSGDRRLFEAEVIEEAFDVFRTMKPGGTLRIAVPSLTRYLDWGTLKDEHPKFARYASLPGIMKAKKKEVKAVGPGDIGLDAGEVGAAGAKAKRVKLMPLPERPPGKMIDAEDPAAAAAELVRLLREEAKVL